ncbi:hypothetical protein SFC76_05405 [Sphingomonas sp. CD22]|uniref:hypothetical protein n=1 Tax=Sphingomonas sp. CD22 TaxID=3100214 RepID=UPI002AE0830F|nr:hypothetical protein [Sphingomonas sp. CD22]MEA1083690.1 hypothetical protein [Sphingomonas sp. CD22]
MAFFVDHGDEVFSFSIRPKGAILTKVFRLSRKQAILSDILINAGVAGSLICLTAILFKSTHWSTSSRKDDQFVAVASTAFSLIVYLSYVASLAWFRASGASGTVSDSLIPNARKTVLFYVSVIMLISVPFASLKLLSGTVSPDQSVVDWLGSFGPVAIVTILLAIVLFCLKQIWMSMRADR